MLPGMSGIELAITMRRIFPDCKVLLFSGQAATSDLLTSARRSGHEFTLLNKPVYPTDLLRRVSESLDPRRVHSATLAS
jgi:CheY-like chemotaxis protein